MQRSGAKHPEAKINGSVCTCLFQCACGTIKLRMRAVPRYVRSFAVYAVEQLRESKPQACQHFQRHQKPWHQSYVRRGRSRLEKSQLGPAGWFERTQLLAKPPQGSNLRDAVGHGTAATPPHTIYKMLEPRSLRELVTLTLETRARVAVSTLRASGTRTSPFGPGHYMYTVRTATICPRAYIRPSARVPAWRPDTSVSEPSVKHTSMMQ